MFDSRTRQLLRNAPELSDLDPETIDELLTEAHVELATARLASQDDFESQPETFIKVRRLASTFEAFVALNLRPEQMRSAAFVAGTAHQILTQRRIRRPDQPTLLSSDAVDSTISATLLFLIADRAADAAEIASCLSVIGETREVRRSLILSIKDFATGRLEALSERRLPSEAATVGDSRDQAADLLFRECNIAIKNLALEARGIMSSSSNVRKRLNKTIELASPFAEPLESNFQGLIHHQFAGPHHLASLLVRMVGGARASMLVRLPTPAGADALAWAAWTISQAQTRPFLWINHQEAVKTGYLGQNSSMVMTSPTGSGKTTLSMLKIASTRCAGKSVIYLAPTHALVDQIEEDFTKLLAEIDAVSVEDTALQDLDDTLPPFAVMTPERCLALLGFAPGLFSNVGLLVFDEFHLISAETNADSHKVNPRAIDAMLALLTFTRICPKADLLLMSAMVQNAREVADWLREISTHNFHVFDDPWKPARQLRSCVIYDRDVVNGAIRKASRASTQKARGRADAQPLGLFSLISGWHPNHPEKLVVRSLTNGSPALTLNKYKQVTANRNEVAAQLAADFAALGKRVIVFCADSRACSSVAKAIDLLLEKPTSQLNGRQSSMRDAIIEDVGSVSAAFDPSLRRAAVHHGDLLPLERRLVENVFRQHREKDEIGLDVIAATSTIAQGLNLPCDVVILAGTDRSAIDDPNGNPRTSLRPHEILNALGRAGRASYAATGLSIVIPASPLLIDLNDFDFPRQHPDLPMIFSEQDACEDIQDPIERLLDQIEASADADGRTQAMIRRLSASTHEGQSGFDEIVGRSFGFFQKSKSNTEMANRWLEYRRLALVSAAESLEDPETLDWQEDIAVRNGISPVLITRLADALTELPKDLHSTADWMGWILDIVAECPSNLTLFARPAALEAVFGRAYQHDDVSARYIISALKKLVAMWCSGKPLVAIEKWLLEFIRENEGNVRRQTTKSSTAHHARRFVIRITPDLGFLCGVLSQVAAYLYSDAELSPLEIVDLLPQMVRYGDHDRHHMVLRQNMTDSSRVSTYHAYKRYKSRFNTSSMISFDSVRDEVNEAIFLEALEGFNS
ncbi:DEAD/DEAH box helicase [Pseudomonas putida]|uniref:DEAD/DEAH box helicase n=1 Tax=Pseudomonas putida TaxID=303 RepID=A0A1L5PQU7_PSEPU|nr:DEAD/DEAH box helicase [Pseudomonas putida]APO82540.1 DEAD/DEAH box helicase [Pseudomonas putida]